MTEVAARQAQFTLSGFGLVLVLAWLCYWPAVYGDFRLDDRANLSELTYVEDLGSAVDFVLSGNAGPTGRPLALASFALQAGAWEDGPAAFLVVNILIHLLNAVLLCVCCYLLARQRHVGRDNAILIAAATAALWVLMPLLASATMLVVQRMTTLSATFLLLGLAGYLAARANIDERPGRSLAGMSASLVAGTALATLCKESGLLLPVLVLVLEATVLDRPRGVAGRAWRAWQAAFLVLPLAGLLVYLVSLLPYPEALAAQRGFDGSERLLTQARVLWMYVYKAAVGVPGGLGIYQTPPEISRSLFEPLTFAAVASWTGLLVAAVALRRRQALFALGVLWFCAAHLLESTTVSVEIYFEHRNYLAVAGPLFAVASAVVTASARTRRTGAAALAVVLVVNAYFLYTFASIWGEPSRSSRYWALKYPDSARAVTTMATYQLAEEGPLRTLETIDRFVIDNPEHAYLRIQELNLRCLVMPDENHDAVLLRLERELPAVGFTFTAGRMLSEFLDTATAVECRGVDTGTVARVAELLHSNPRYAAVRRYSQFHYKLLAAIARLEGDHAATLAHLRRAIEYRPSTELNMMMVTALAGAGDFDAALDFIDDARGRTPGNYVRAVEWQRDLDGLETYVVELRAAIQREMATEDGTP